MKNAIIESATIGYEDHGILIFMLDLRHGECTHQGFGGYALKADHIKKILDVAGVQSWDQLKGKTIRIVRHDGFIQKIGHIIEDKWFDPREEEDDHRI